MRLVGNISLILFFILISTPTISSRYHGNDKDADDISSILMSTLSPLSRFLGYEQIEEDNEKMTESSNPINGNANKLSTDQIKSEEESNFVDLEFSNKMAADEHRDSKTRKLPLLSSRPVDEDVGKEAVGFGNSSLDRMVADGVHQHGSFVMEDLNRYLSACPDCVGHWDQFQCPLHDKAVELKKWISELHELLSFGCHVDGSCTDRKCCHTNSAIVGDTLRDFTNMAQHMYNSFQSSCSSCPVDGAWSEWCEWGACSVTCGGGTRTRSRECSNPAPRGLGKACPGLPVETHPCNLHDCCLDGYWSQWESWTGCSASCGSGMRERRRRCDDPAPNYCGKPCPGPQVNTEICMANVPCAPLCVHGNWGPWQPWSGCSATCGSGMQSRLRRCDNPQPNYCGNMCHGSASDTRICHTSRDCCVNGNWGQWEQWSLCSATCGQGSRDRRRHCDSPSPNSCGQPCMGARIESNTCYGTPCAPKCAERDWSSWSQWSACDATCGSGLRSRRRTCQTIVSGADCGPACPGQGEQLEGCVGLAPCEQPWGPWSACSATCAGYGMRERTRVFDSSDKQRQTCQVFSPPCHPAQWSEWGNWCPCDCQTGMRWRTRTCTRRNEYGRMQMVNLAECGGSAGSARQEEMCNVRLSCPTCVADCRGKPNGDYPACTSCGDYVRCVNGMTQTFSCTSPNQWDDFVKRCAPARSPSCVLATCVRSCAALADGSYPSCNGCGAYMDCRGRRARWLSCPAGFEFNAHTHRCESGNSPTCSQSSDRYMVRDAPADAYFPGEDLEEGERQTLYLQLREKAGVAAMFNRSEEDVFGEANKEKTDISLGGTFPDQTPGKNGRKTGAASPKCLKDCRGVERGVYQSCRGCSYYLQCTGEWKGKELKCALNKFWDDKRKKCKHHSSTCTADNLAN